MKDIYDSYDSLVAAKANAMKMYSRSNKAVKKLRRDYRDYEKARIVITELSRVTQHENKEKIEKLVTLAIRSVFENQDYQFRIKFERKNNRVYAIPVIVENNEEFDPKNDMGGGLIDIVSIALKIILWHMEDPRKRNVLITDEPFRFTGALVKKAGHMLKFIADKLNLQVIMVSHDDDLIDICDRVYRVSRKGKASSATLIKRERKIKRRKNA